MRTESPRSRRALLRRPLGRGSAAVALLLVSTLALVTQLGGPAGADGGDIQSINFAAEDPDEYDHATGGGAFGSDTDGDGKDTVESLQGGDFACGDIVTYFVELVVQGDGSDDAQTIQLTNTFLADATGQTGAGLTDVVNVLIDPSDPAQANDGDSTVTVLDEGVDQNGAAPYANDGQTLAGGNDATYVTYTVDGLETGEIVVVRIDVQIECAANTSPTGNLQGNLTEADVVAINGGNVLPVPDAVAGGNQTIPFQQIGSLVGGGEPLLEIQKTVMALGGTCGVDDVELLNVTQGDTVTYCYLITNDGTADLANTSITDDNGTPGDQADDFTIAVGTVPAISSITVQEDVVISSAGTTTNTATATGDGPQNSTLTDSDTATVEAENSLEPPVAELIKGNEAGNDTVATVDEPGGSYVVPVSVTNTGGDATLTSLIDVPGGDITQVQGDITATTCSVPQTLATGDTYTCEFTTSFSGGAGDSLTDLLTATLENSAGTSTDDDQATVVIGDVPATIEVIKTADPTEVSEGGETVTFSFVVNNLSTVDSVTIDTLSDTIYGDITAIAGSTCSVPQTLAVDGSYSCSFDALVIATETNVITASGFDDDGKPVSDTDDATVTVTDVPSSINVTKTANPTTVPETGGDVTFTFVVENTSATDDVTIDSLSDSIYGDLNGQGTCDTGATLAPGESYTCSITELVTGDAGQVITNILTVAGTDDDGQSVDGTDDAEVAVTDVPATIEVVKTADPTSVAEPGGDVTYTFTVRNTSVADVVTVTSLIDSIYGDLVGQGNCGVGAILNVAGAAGDTYTCSITVNVTGDPGDTVTNQLDVVGTDDDGGTVTGSDTADVTVTDVPSSIVVTKSADPVSVPETGGDVTYTVVVENTSAVDSVTITSIDDDPFGDLAADCSPALPATLAPGEAITCTYTEFVAGIVGTPFVNVATATGTDDDGNPVTDDDFVDVTFDDVLPDVSITKSANPTSVDEPGGDVEFTIVVTNNSIENVQLDSLTDSDFDLAGRCDPQGTVLSTDGTYTCTFTEFIAGNFGDDHNNVATIVASDDDGNSVTASDDADVVINDVPSSIEVTKTADVASVPETGGDVTYTVVLENTSAVDDVTIESVIDDQFGDVSASCVPALPATLAPGETLTCTFTETISGNAGTSHVNVVTGSGTDDDGNPVEDDDSEDVPFDDVLPDVSITKSANPTSVDEPGGDVEFTIVVTNDSAEAATIDSLVDSDFDLAVNCADAVGTVLGEGDSYTCTFTEFVGGNFGQDHNNVATVVASDDEGNADTESDDADVVINNLPSSIVVTKSADPLSVPETGGDVTFTFVVENTSAADDVTIDSLIDSIYGNLNGQGDCVTGATLAPGESYTCEITETVSGNAGEVVTNVLTVTGTDDDGEPVGGEDDADVTLDDVLPDVSIVKSANPTSVDEPGGDVEFTIVVTNNSLEDATIDSLVDSDFDLAVNCADAVGTVLGEGDSYTCTFIEFVAGNPADGDHENTATVVASDDEGNTDEASDDETVVINDVAPVIEVTKTADQAEVFAPGEDVTFTIQVDNNSVGSDPVTITSLVDDVFGDLTVECVLPQTIGVGGSFQCDITRTIVGDHTNTVTATGVDDEGTEVSDSDDASVDYVNPAIAIEKNTGPADADTAPGPEILAGETVSWFYQVTNVGDVTLTGLDVTDDQGVQVSCAVDSLLAGASTVCEGSGTATEGQYANIGTVSASYTDADGDTADVTDSDPSHYFGAAPSVGIVKTFGDDSVTAGGAGSSFTLVVTNDGNVDLSDVAVSDLVDDRLTVTGVSGTAGADNGSNGQAVEWLIPSLGAGESATITVDFSVASDVPEANGVGGLNDDPSVPNDATASSVYTDAIDNSTTVSDSDDDSVDIVVDISLDIVKTFDPTSVPQGTLQSFTLEVSNAGPSDAVGVSVTDVVDSSLDVQGASVTSGTGDCSASAGQNVDCTVDIPAGQSVTVTVTYLVAPFLGDDGSTTGGDTFRFVFAGGDVLEGSTATGEVFLNGADVSGDVTIVSSLTRNDVIFDPDGPGGEPAIELHLSCSDPFTGGWGQSGGPVEGVNSADYQVAFFSIGRYNNNGFIKSCGNVTNPYDVANTGTASGEDSFGTDTVSDSATVTVEPGITITRLQTAGKRLTVRLTNMTGEDKTIADISAIWPDSNGNLTKIRLDEPTVWDGSDDPTDAFLDANDPGWNGGTLSTGEGILRFDFARKSARNGYTIRVTFTDGTFLDISA